MKRNILLIALSFISISTFAQSWQEVEKLVLPNRFDNDNAGTAVSVYGDYAVVGAPNEDQDSMDLGNVSSAGSVTVYKRLNMDTSWNFHQKIVANDRKTDDFFGYRVLIQGDFIIVGAYGHDFDSLGSNFLANAGAVYIFKYNSSTGKFMQYQKLVAENRTANAFFGSGIAIDGNILAVGAPLADSGSVSKSGAVYMYELNISTGYWEHTVTIASSDKVTTDGFGQAISISNSTLLVGAQSQDYDKNGAGKLSNSGAAYFFKRNFNKSWTEVAKVTASDRQDIALFGATVAVDGKYAVIGAPNNNTDSLNNNTMLSSGAAYLFENKNGEWTFIKKITAKYRSIYGYFGYSVDVYGTLAVIGCYQDKYLANGTSTALTGGSAYLYRRSVEGIWMPEKILNSKIRAHEDAFGKAVAVYKRTVMVGAPGEDEDINNMFTTESAGGAYMYELFCNNTYATIDVVGCGSYTSPSGNYTWTTPGKYYDVITNRKGCDSIITINLTMATSSSASINETACGSYTSPSGNYTWTDGGTYKDTITNTAGCDSLITINLTVIEFNKTITAVGAILTSNQANAGYKWLDCTDYSEVPGEIGQSYIAIANGGYAVEVSKDGCVDTSECFMVTQASVPGRYEDEFKIYPNPSNGIVNIEFTNTPTNMELTVTNALGEVVMSYQFSGNKLQVNLPTAEGVYFIHLTVDGKQRVVKVIKTE